MATEFAPAKNQLITEGYCVVDGELPSGRLEELRDWSDNWLDKTAHPSKWKYQGSDIKLRSAKISKSTNNSFESDAMVDFLIEHPNHIIQGLGLYDFNSIGLFQIIAKPGQSPGLYWHQDWMRWNDPISLSPWCQTVFLNWYLTDTDRENGCLRVIPGSHRRRFDLHEHLIPPHEGGGYEIEETNQWMFLNHPQAIDVPVNAGQLVVADARLLHGTHPNKTDERRTLLLGWFFRRDTNPPKWWEGEVPQEILDRDPLFKADWTRQPGDYLR